MTNEHPDDEAISAHLDGEATAAEDAHIARCDVCRARLDALRSAAAAIGSPPAAPSPEEQERAIAAAIAAASPATVTPLHRGRRLPRWLPAAAAVLVVVGGVALVADLGSGDGGDDLTATGEPQQEMAERSLDDAGATGLGMGRVTVDGGDIGAVSARDLRSVVEAALAGEADAATAGEAAPGPQAEATPAPCEDRARNDFDDLGALRYRAVGTFEGDGVSILAFDLPSDEPRLRVLVLALDDCTIRLAQEIAAGP